VFTFTPWLFYCQIKSLLYPWNKRLGGPQNRSGISDEEKTLFAPLVIETNTIVELYFYSPSGPSWPVLG
jgi:hypothetical protein